MEKIIGRDDELAKLAEIAGSGRPEFVAVYGRRRVGKTFLVRSAFGHELDAEELDSFEGLPA